MTKLAIPALVAALAAVTVPVLAQPPADANRDAFYCEERKLGSWFYCNSEEAKRKAREKAQAPAPAAAVPATARMAAITAQLDELKARAVLETVTDAELADGQYYDVDGDGDVDAADIIVIKVVRKVKALQRERHLALTAIFKTFDKNQDGEASTDSPTTVRTDIEPLPLLSLPTPCVVLLPCR